MTNEEAVEYINFYQNHICHDCDPKIGYGCSENCDFCEEREAFDKAIEALKRLIPIKPKGRCDNDGYFNAGALCKCPDCDSMVIQNLSTIKTDYCKRCGQAIDWSEE